MTQDGQAVPSNPEAESGRVYKTVTRYWPRIAVGLVVGISVAEWVVGGLTADTGVEFYLMAWAATTGGLWFLFEKAENALGEESHTRVVGWLGETDFRGSVRSIPSQFALLFDRVFGERHLSVTCFLRSSGASIASVAVMVLLLGGAWGEMDLESALAVGSIVLLTNVIPDYVSLFETRWAIRLAENGRRMWQVLVLDFVLTAVISMAAVLMVLNAMMEPNTSVLELGIDVLVPFESRDAVAAALGTTVHPVSNGFMSVFFLSAFFTSAWLWLYAASVLVSRVLVRMGGGVGFLLRVTDVEKQPFRSMGFVSVIIVSVLFALGLPFVLL